MKALRFESHGLSDVGLRRANNEDVFIELKKLGFFALADGMGGHLAGEVAARLAIDTLCCNFLTALGQSQMPQHGVAHYLEEPFYSFQPRTATNVLRHLSKAIHAANIEVHRTASLNDAWAGMGTTLSCLFFHNSQLFYGHVGDSRIYCFRHTLEQLTHDHCVSEELILDGTKTHLNMRLWKHRHRITRAIGTNHCVEPEIGLTDVLPGDLYLICSDGLSDQVSHAEISEMLISSSSTQQICERLIKTANDRGGRDNTTVIAIQIQNT